MSLIRSDIMWSHSDNFGNEGTIQNQKDYGQVVIVQYWNK